LHSAKVTTNDIFHLNCKYFIILVVIKVPVLKKYICTTAFLFFLIPTGFSQSLRQPISAIYLGLASYSTQHQDVFSYLNNQAALAQIKNVTTGVYGEKRFFLSATSLYTAAVAVPTKDGNFGINVKYSGFKNFNENQIGLTYARSLGKKVDVGIQFNYYGYRVPAYNSANTFTVEAGAIIHLTDLLNMGLHIYNPIGGRFSNTNEKLTTAYTVGLGYDVSNNFFVGTEIVKEENFPVNVNTGIQYRFMKQFFARAGIASATSTGYAGVGISWKNLRLDISGSYHPQLGLSPGLLLIMNFGKATTVSTNE